MTPRALQEMLTRMRNELRNPLTKPESWKAFENTAREQWRQKADELFGLIPDEAVRFAQYRAWHVFDNRMPGVLEAFIVGIVEANPLVSARITLSDRELAFCGAQDAEHMLRILFALNTAWQEQVRVFAHHSKDTGLLIQFFAI